jgi:hypothetical protein
LFLVQNCIKGYLEYRSEGRTLVSCWAVLSRGIGNLELRLLECSLLVHSVTAVLSLLFESRSICNKNLYILAEIV